MPPPPAEASVPLPWPADPTLPALLIALAALFALHHYRAHPAALRARYALDLPAAVHASRLISALLLGLAPALIAHLLDHPITPALTLPHPAATALGALALAALALPAVALAARRPDFTDHYPQVRDRPWTPRLALHNALSWAIYLIAYEYFFRGLLLFALAARLDPWTAIALTTLAYVLAHLPKPGRETAGTLPMGIAFAAVTLATGSIWAAVISHWLIANTSDLLAARAGLSPPGR